jgi:hypothetical protein
VSEALPSGMVAVLARLGEELVRWAQAHRESTLAEQEQAVLGLVRHALPALLTVVLAESTSGLHPATARLRPVCPRCGARARVQSWRRRQVLTVCGPISFDRPWYVCPAGHPGFSPVDATLALVPHARLSAGLRAWLVEQGASESFAAAAGTVARLTGLEVAAETVRQHTEAVGAAWEEEQQAAMATVLRTREPAGPVDAAPGTLLVQTDGVMVRYRDAWHEVKIGLVGGQRDGALVAPSYVAARAPAEQFGPRLLAEAARRGALAVVDWHGPLTQRCLAVLRPVVVLGDGAAWIWHLAAEHFGERIEIVDYYHATQHIWTVAKAVYGEGSAKAKRWADRHCRRLLARGPAPLVRAVRAITKRPPALAELLRQEAGYFRTNAARMDYPTFRAQGLPIGSGAVEAEAKRLVQQRMKLSGARWSHPGAQAVLNVRGRLLSGLPLAC